jgi:hypothetical protein
MKHLITLLAISIGCSLVLITSSSRVAAQSNPAMTEQRRDADREALFAQFTDRKRIPTGEQQRLAYETAKNYLDRFGGEDHPNTRAVRKFVVEYERFIREFDVDAAYNAKNYAKVFDLGRVSEKADPNDFFVLATMVKAGYESSQAGNASFVKDSGDYAVTAIKLLEADQNLKPRPFQTRGAAEGFLNFALGWFMKDQSPSDAAPAFVKALKADSAYKTDPGVYRLLGVAILKGDFTKLSAEYNEKFGNKPPSQEQAAMLEKLGHLANRAIDAYARAVALTEQPEAKAKMLTQLSTLYKNFNNGSDAGLNELVASVMSKPLPAN